MADRKPDDEPEPVVEACELLESLYGFDNDDESERYAMAEQFRDDAVRLVVLHFHLTSEELLKAMTYNALRRVEGPETFTEDQDIAYLQALGSADTIDLAGRLGSGVDPLSRTVEQFSAMARTFTSPKNGQTREAPLTEPAREAILSLPIEGEFCFTPIRGSHWTASARAYHWKAVRAAAGWEGSLYLATRHFAGWYMVNVLELPSEDVAIALGHTDGGELVRKLYGHRDRERALARVTAAYEGTATYTQMRLV